MRRVLLTAWAVFCVCFGFSQGEANVWYVGNNIKMDFSGGGEPTFDYGIDLGGLSDHYESTSSISDANGDLLFAAVGDRVYSADGSTINLPANTRGVTQGSLVFPKPGAAGEYFLSVLGYNQTNGNAPMSNYYEIIPQADGSMTTSAAQPMLNQLTQAQAGVPKIDATGLVLDEYWLVTHETCNDAFKVFSVENSGITLNSTWNTGPSLVCDGSSFPAVYDIIGAMKFNSCYTKLAMTMGGSVMLFDFNATTGEISFVNEITTIYQPYGLEFSQNGDYLYVLNGWDNLTSGRIFRLGVDDVTGLSAATDVGGTGGSRGGHLQLAPDGNIYFPIMSANPNYGTGGIGRIENVETGGSLNTNVYSALTTINSPVTINGQAVMMDMPSFLRSFVSSIATLKVNGEDLGDISVCAGQSFDFTIEIEGSLTPGVEWRATGANTDSQTGLSTFSVQLNNPGITYIEVDVEDDCDRKRALSFEINVFENETGSANIAVCPSRVLDGVSSGGSNYFAYYDGSPTVGGNLLGYGSSYDALAYIGDTVYVQPFSDGASNGSFNDDRNSENWQNTTGNTSIVVGPGTAGVINSFYVPNYTNGSYSGTMSLRLMNGGVQVGSVVEHVMPAGGNGDIQFSPVDWVISEGTYSVEVVTTGGASFGKISVDNYSDQGILIDGGRTYGYSIEMVDIPEALGCYVAGPVYIPSCCTAPGATVEIQGATNDTIKACDNTTIDANISGGGSVFQWYQLGVGTFGAEGGAPGTTETSGSISVSGLYAINVADDTQGLTNCADGDTVYVLVTATPSTPSVTAVSICTGQQLNLAVNSANTDYTYNWTGPNAYSATGATQTVIANATITPTDYSGNYPVTATENGCTSTASNLAVTLTQSPTVTVNVDTTFCAYPFDLADLHGTPSNGTISYLDNANGSISSTVNADATYKIVVADGSCADTTDVTTTETGDPTASWAGGSGVCAGNSTDLTVTITGGSANYTVYYTDGSSPANATHTASGQAISLGAGTYTLDSVVDNNGCSHLNIGDTETISTQADVDATVSVLCDGEPGVDGALAFNQFQIMVNIDAGDTSNVAIDIVGTTFGVTFSETSTGIWHSSPIVEDTTLDIRIRDTRCDTITESYNRICSCPGIATLSGATTVCNNETAELTLTVDGDGPFDFELHNNNSVYNNATVLGLPYTGTQTGLTPPTLPMTITITVQDSGTYSIANLKDYEGGATACDGSEIGNILVGYHTHPDGDIGLDAVTGESPICPDGNTDVDIDVTQGAQGPFTVYYSTEGSQTTGVTTGTGLGTIDVIADTGTVILDSIVDANGCASTNINETVTITAHDTLIVDVQTTCSDDAGTATPNDGYTVSVVATQSSINTVSINSGSITNSGGTWTSSIINEGTPVEITVTDVNGCNTVVVSDIQRTCSCPTAAVLTHAATPEGCEGDMVTLQLDTTAGAMSSTSFTASVTGPNGVTPINITAGTVLPYEFTVADSGLYTLTVFTDNTGDNGSACNAQLDDDTAQVNIYSLPTATLAGGSESCIGSPSDPVTINVTGAGSSWDVDYTQDATANNTTITSAGESTLIGSTTNAADTGTYTITGVTMDVGNNLTCTGTSFSGTPEIKFSPAQGASIDSDVDICKDSTGTLTANNEGGGVTYSWTLNGDEVGTSLTQDVTNAAGVYTLTTKKNGCADQTATATVTVTEIVVVANASQTLISEGDAVTLSTVTSGSTNPISCQWYDPTFNPFGTSCTEVTTPVTPGGIYTVISSDGQCEATDQIEVSVVVPIQVPDAFTPNADGVNDYFTITGFETYTGGSVAIYNRWGNLVYYVYGGENYAAEPWDGTMNGKELPAGVYYYTIDLGLSEEDASLVPDAAPKSGSIMLMK